MENYTSEKKESNMFVKEYQELDIVNCIPEAGQDASLILRRRAMTLDLWNLPQDERDVEKNDMGWKRICEELIQEKFWKNIPVSLTSVCWDNIMNSTTAVPVQ